MKIVFERSQLMAVQFILGENQNQKRKIMIDNIYEHLEKNPDAEVIYLVPDNVKYEAETMVLEHFKKKSKDKMAGMIRLQIFSFSRLAWYLLQDKAIYQKPQLTDSGLAMLLKKILKEEEEKLTIYRGTSQESGFIQRLITLFSEFRNGKIQSDDLEEILLSRESETEGKDFEKKMKDLSYLYKKYDQALAGSYIEREDLYKELIQHISNQSEKFSKSVIYVDHYEHFSAQELELLTTLARHSSRLLINLTLSQKSLGESYDYNNLFYRPLKSYFQLKDTFQGNAIKILKDLFIEKQEAKNQELDLLKNYWLQSNQGMTQIEQNHYQKRTYKKIEIWESEDVDAEVFHLASEIKKMIATGQYRYKDFQIMTRNLSDYELSFEAIFNKNNLPFFIDEKETMAQHPLLEFIVSLFSLKKRYFRRDDIFRFLRTELFIPIADEIDSEGDKEEKNIQSHQENTREWREKVDLAENVSLAFNYQGADWVRDEDWHYSRFDIDEKSELSKEEIKIGKQANEVRAIFREKILPFIQVLDQVKSNKELAYELYQFMEDIHVRDTLESWWNELADKGQLEEAEKHEQAWEKFIEILDEFVELLGEGAWDLESFLSIIETGFEEATYSMLPPTIDQLLITDYDLPKIQSKKIVFVIGLTDTNLPQIEENKSLLTDEDREIFESALDSDKYLAVSGVESMANEPFGFYLALLQANEKIYFSYPSTNSEHKENRMSPYLARIKEAFALKLKVKYGHSISLPKDAMSPFDYLEFIVSKEQAFSEMIINLRHSLDNIEQPQAFWGTLFKKLYDPTDIKENNILKSLSHRNIPVPLNEDLAEELYGKDLHLSVSQLESFYTDPYSHFLIYGLGLRERQRQELTPLESGNFYHEALDLITYEIIQSDRDMADFDEKDLNKMTKKIFADLLSSNKYRLAQSSYRMNFIFKQLSKTVRNIVWSMIKQSKRSSFRPQKTELVFGQLAGNKGIEGLSFDLKNNRKLQLRGKIDRIDSFKKDDQLFTGVVDYKSSDTTFNFQNIYHGLMLQMITYLDTVLTYSENIFGEDALGIGAFYSTVTDHLLDIQKLGQKDYNQEKLKQYKHKGIIIYRDEVLEAADTLLKAKEISPIYPVRLLKSGNYTKTGTLSEEEFEWLIRFNREKIVEAGNKIISGKNTLRPYDKRQAKIYTPSVDGPYRAISQFDALLKENNYQEIKKMNQKEFFNDLKKRYDKGQENRE